MVYAPNLWINHFLRDDLYLITGLGDLKEEGKIITYEMLELFGVDSVVFTKNGDLDYSIDFAEVGTYERFYGEED